MLFQVLWIACLPDRITTFPWWFVNSPVFNLPSLLLLLPERLQIIMLIQLCCVETCRVNAKSRRGAMMERTSWVVRLIKIIFWSLFIKFIICCFICYHHYGTSAEKVMWRIFSVQGIGTSRITPVCVIDQHTIHLTASMGSFHCNVWALTTFGRFLFYYFFALLLQRRQKQFCP
jgi:hypothetical protein